MPVYKPRRKRNVVINKEARELFIRSDIDLQYHWLLKLLKQPFYEKVYRTDFEDTNDFDYKRRNFIINVFPKLKDSISKQWFRSTDMIIKENGQCELCGKKHTKYMYYIKNRINHNKMLVGSTCIENFKGIDIKMPKGVTLEQFTNKQKREMEKIYRLELFSQRFGNIEKTIKDWNDEYRNLPLEVGEDLHNQILKIHKEARQIYTNYINKSLSQNSLEDLEKLINLRKEIMKKINSLIKHNINYRFACTKEVGNWLQENDREEILRRIRKNNGVISRNEINEIYQPRYVKRLVETRFIKMWDSSTFIKDSIDTQHIYFTFINKNKRVRCKLRLSFKDLMNNFGQLLFIKGAFISNKDLLNYAILTRDEINYNLIHELNLELKDTHYYIENYKGEAYYLVNKATNEYASKLDVMELIDRQKKLILLNHGIEKDIINIIKQINKWEPRSNLEKYDIGNISNTYR